MQIKNTTKPSLRAKRSNPGQPDNCLKRYRIMTGLLRLAFCKARNDASSYTCIQSPR